MRLSEAIRLGSMLRPQGFGAFRDHGKTCALGAACDALGVKRATQARLRRLYPWLGQIATDSLAPVAAARYLNSVGIGGKNVDVYNLILYLNDSEEYTREAIADILAKIEPAEAVDNQGQLDLYVEESESSVVPVGGGNS